MFFLPREAAWRTGHEHLIIIVVSLIDIGAIAGMWQRIVQGTEGHFASPVAVEINVDMPIGTCPVYRCVDQVNRVEDDDRVGGGWIIGLPAKVVDVTFEHRKVVVIAGQEGDSLAAEASLEVTVAHAVEEFPCTGFILPAR